MNRAEEVAEKAVPIIPDYEGKNMFNRAEVRALMMHAYYQAEKDLALTWEDIELITRIEYEVIMDSDIDIAEIGDEEIAKKILERLTNRERNERGCKLFDAGILW